MKNSFGVEVISKEMWHGTSTDNAKKIKSKGFIHSPRQSGAKKPGVFAGDYLSASNYTKRRDADEYVKRIYEHDPQRRDQILSRKPSRQGKSVLLNHKSVNPWNKNHASVPGATPAHIQTDRIGTIKRIAERVSREAPISNKQYSPLAIPGVPAKIHESQVKRLKAVEENRAKHPRKNGQPGRKRVPTGKIVAQTRSLRPRIASFALKAI